MSKQKVDVHVGGGFTGLLTILFIALKLMGHIDWSWWWVFAPMWIPWVIILSVFCVGAVITLLVK